MSGSSKAVFILFILGVSPARADAQGTSTGPVVGSAGGAAQPVKDKAAAGPELNGYKQAAWGMSKDQVKAGLHVDFARSEPSHSIMEMPWEILRLSGLSESDPDELLGGDMEWFSNGPQDAVFGFYKGRFFAYTGSLDKILPVSDYRQKIISIHGGSSRALSFENTDPVENTVIGSYNLELWEKKRTVIILGTEKLYPGAEPEINYEITYLGADIFGEFKSGVARALEQKKDEETKRSEKLLREQQKNALEAIQ